MFWHKKKDLESKEYRELKQQIDLLWLELDIITKRYRRKVEKKQELTEEEEELLKPSAIDDGFNELRKINKEANR